MCNVVIIDFIRSTVLSRAVLKTAYLHCSALDRVDIIMERQQMHFSLNLKRLLRIAFYKRQASSAFWLGR